MINSISSPVSFVQAAGALLLLLSVSTTGIHGAPEAAPRIRFSYVEEHIPEAGTIQKTKVAIGALTFICRPPINWRADGDEQNSRVQFRSLPLSAGISITLLPSVPQNISGRDLRARLAQEFTDLEIIEEYKAYTRGPEGTAFELRQTISGKFTSHFLLMYIPLKHNLLELRLASPEETFEQCRPFWPQFLNSFSLEEPAPEQSAAIKR